MLAQVDIQKEIYEGRIKARRDERMRWNDALTEGHAEGRAEGRAEGILMGRIEVAQKLLHREGKPRAELEALTLEALESLAEELERELLGSDS